MSFLLEAKLVTRQKGESDSVISLAGADLNRTDLQEAVLRDADLTDAYLTRADLSGAEVTQDQLDEAAYLEGATMPNGQKYEDWIKDKEGQNISYSRSLPSRLRAALARVLPGVRVPPHRGRASAPDQAQRGSLTSEYTSSRHLGD